MEACERRPSLNYVLTTRGGDGASEGAYGEDQGVVRAEGIDVGGSVIVKKAHAETVSADVLSTKSRIYLFDAALSLIQINVKYLPSVSEHG